MEFCRYCGRLKYCFSYKRCYTYCCCGSIFQNGQNRGRRKYNKPMNYYLQCSGSTLHPNYLLVALIAAGQSSTITGTLAGQIVMEGYLSLRINPLMRRLITRLLAVIPALIVMMILWRKQDR